MYFPNLESLKNSSNNELIQRFDSWLGTMAPLYARKIDVKDYAVKEKLDLNICLYLFDMAVKCEILIPKIIVVDDYGTNHGTFYNNSEIPSKLMNYEFNKICIIEERNKEIIYELIERPKKQAVLESKKVANGDCKDENSSKVTIENLKKSNAAATLELLGVDF